MLYKFLNKFFDFTRRETNGVLALLIIILLLLITRIILPYVIIENKNDFSESYQNLLSSIDTTSVENISEEKIKSTDIVVHGFNPQTVTYKELLSLGFSKYQAGNLVAYRKAGGKFYKPSDVLKIYGIDTVFYHSIEPYIQIELLPVEPKKEIIKQPKSQTIISKQHININKASITKLKSINGIGDKRSATIVKYRDMLGGFVSEEQYKEIYGLPDSLILKLNDIAVIDTNLIKRLSLNHSSFSDLIKHPYLSKYQVQAILNYRQAVGEIKSVEELLSNNLIDKETFLKIRFYLKK